MTKSELALLSQNKVMSVKKFINHLKHVKSPWRGATFELLDWQMELIKGIYGTLKPDGFRQYTTAYIEIPKKQGKSELLSALALYQLCADGEYFAEVYGCATDQSNARIIFDVAVEMVDQCPELKKHIKPILSTHRLIYMPTKSFYQVMSAESYTKHGYNISTCLFDELHAQPNRKLWDVMTFGAGDARKQPLWFVITTAGNDPDRTSVCWEQHQKAEQVLLGYKKIPTLYPMIYGVDVEHKRIWTGRQKELLKKGETWESPRLWNLVNPSLNATVDESKLKEAFQDVKGQSAQENLFKQLRLNIWVKERTHKWISTELWDKNAGIVVPEELKGRRCFGGLDLSTKIDMTAFVLIFPPETEDGKFEVLPTFWVPEESLAERVARDRVPYDEWLNNGFIKATPGNAIDYRFIVKEICDLRYEYEVIEIGFDPWNAQQTANELTDEGFLMVEVRQGSKSMSPGMKELERMLRSKLLNHGGHPVLKWNVNNVEIRMDENENIKPIKSKSTERIDGLVALINAIVRWQNTENRPSIYETRGVINI
ncbi:MAG: terminase TerL endonuclease subunit [Patescibacteria group bacterium]